jgi:hypothetical protein
MMEEEERQHIVEDTGKCRPQITQKFSNLTATTGQQTPPTLLDQEIRFKIRGPGDTSRLRDFRPVNRDFGSGFATSPRSTLIKFYRPAKEWVSIDEVSAHAQGLEYVVE